MTPASKPDPPWWVKFIEKFGISTVILAVILWWCHFAIVEIWNSFKQWGSELIKPAIAKHLELVDSNIKSNNRANELLSEIQKTQLENGVVQRRAVELLDSINKRMEKNHSELKTEQHKATTTILHSLEEIGSKLDKS